jgi:hypothetical protein
MPVDSKLGKQHLDCRDLVRFFVDLDMGENQIAIGGKGAQHLSGLAIVEAVEAVLEHLAVESQPSSFGPTTVSVEPGSMLAKGGFDGLGIKPLQDIADCRMGGRSLPVQAERLIQARPMYPNEAADATIRVCSGDDRQNREQQNVRKSVALPLGSSRIIDLVKQCEKLVERRRHGNLPEVRLPRRESRNSS